MSEKRGIFISFEGPEGSGKTTQIQLLKSFLEEQKYQCVLSYEPGGGSQISKSLRDLLLNRDSKICPQAELLMMLAARAEHVDKFVRPQLNSGKVVLCDRFVDSSYAYQGYGRGLDLATINQFNQFATVGCLPDLTFIFDIAPEVGLKRATGNSAPDRMESEYISFHEKVRQGFLDLAASGGRYRLVSLKNRNVEDVQQELRASLVEWLETSRKG